MLNTVAIHTLGCKLNFSESSTIGQQFLTNGFSVVDFGSSADVYVFNTCTVTENAERECRQLIRKALRTNPDAYVIVTGCYAQLRPEEIASIEGVNAVLGSTEKFKLFSILNDFKSSNLACIHVGSLTGSHEFGDASSTNADNRTRAYFKIQDGCDYNCSFCTIPQARGKSRSDTIQAVIDRAIMIAEKGVKEIVLTGVNIGDFKGDDPSGDANGYHFIDLMKALEEESSVPRFRISSIEPNLCSDAVIEQVSLSSKFMPHFHMPLQSGNNKQLAMMRRRYRRELYEDRVNKIRKLMPHACIGADVIVGFPGETAADFDITAQFIKDLRVDYLHVFTYSERANTLALEMHGVVPMEERRQRNELLRAISSRKQSDFYRRHLSTTREVLLERGKSKETLLGFTDNYIKVEVTLSDAENHVNQLYSILLREIVPDGLVKGSLSLEVKSTG